MDPECRVGTGPAGEDRRTPLELAHQGLPRLAALLPEIRWEIVDTNVLLKNIKKDVELLPSATAMRQLRTAGALRLLAPDHVELEMEEHLDRWMTDRNVDPALARSIWEHVYKPAIRFVDMGAFAAKDSRLVALRARDPDDVPTAALALLLGRKALSEDRHLIDYGLATGQPWLRTVLATGHVALGETVQFGAVGTVAVTGQGIAQLALSARALSTTRDGRRLLLALGLLVLGSIAFAAVLRRRHEPSRQWLDQTAGAVTAALQEGGRVVVSGYVAAERNRRTGETTLQAGVVASAHPTALQRAARILASAAGPLPSNELARRVWSYQRAPRAKTEDIRAQLAALPAFVQVEPDAWQLGRTRPTPELPRSCPHCTGHRQQHQAQPGL
jgi:predicted nucleic acid-binding protein